MSIARSAPLRSAISNGLKAQQARTFSTAKAAGSINVAAADDGAPTSTITVAVKAGPRYEAVPGAAHVLKDFLFKSTDKRSALRLIRETELNGGVLSTSLTKEHLLLTAEFLRGDEDYFVEILGDVLSRSKFARHEFEEEVVPQVQAEYGQAFASPEIIGYDSLLQTAYRQRGLGSSLFASPVTPVSYKTVVDYAKQVFSKNNIAVLGSGIEAGKLSELVSKNFADVSASGSVPSTASKYFGGEQRVAFAAPHGSEGGRASFGHFFVGYEGAGLNDAKSAAEFSVLRSLLGGESSVKWSKGLSPLSQISESVAGAKAEAFNLTFSDSGIFGAYISAPHAAIQEAASKAAQAIKEVAGGIKEEDVQKAIAKAKFESAAALESRSYSHQAAGGQLLDGGKISTLEESFSALDAVKASGLSSIAEKLLKSKPTTVAVGDLHKLPYADECL
ncbi:putative QCR2-40 kDa ubiquinol cytochrome-c reductase core protein 2 [Violaceomyces palustris]|uniref:QCR2-40 kDa ubiquinol cytochrome-c reductase core protein 2 n=1 Tax=Violaceomyces palustris TaxID=1673888 RepID=A0ACD0P1P0_9BASI|nr:putative QCR2-40 kDa ubiquinol cytochrome-c reductase core protein 2 [Violaceomyces palustris]